MIEIKSKSISPLALAASIGAGNAHRLLDVRAPPEYAGAHVPGATFIPLAQLSVEAFLREHRPGTPIYVICQAGPRAIEAIEQFKRAGCGDCVLVEGGTQAWIDAGLPVHRGASGVLPILRQVQMVVGVLSAGGAIVALALNRWFALLPLVIGCGLLFAGVTGTCGMALLLARMPWNRGRGREAVSCHCCTSE